MAKIAREQLEKNYETTRTHLRAFERPADIATAEGWNLRTTERYVQRCREQDQKRMDKVGVNGFVTEYLRIIDLMEDEVRKLKEVREKAMQRTFKGEPSPDILGAVQASNAIREDALSLVALIAEGPTVWALRRKGERTAQLDKARQPNPPA